MGVLLPQTYMNDSGSCGRPRARRARRAARPRGGDPRRDRPPFGRVEARLGGGLAGHNGLKSLKRDLGGPDFRRVRVGVGRPDSTDPEIVSAWVLGRFSEPPDEVRALVEQAADELERLVVGPDGLEDGA